MRCIALAACLVAGTCAAAEFRVASSVYEGDNEKPLSTNLTLFRAGVVYDIVETEPRECTVFDARRGRLVLLDPERKQKAELTTRDLTAFSAEVRQRARGSRDPLLKFIAAPEFEIAEVVGPARIEFRSPLMKYSVEVQNCADEIAAEYREFADWYSQLNTLTRAQALPGFARMEVNRQLAENSQVPREVQLTLESPGLRSDTQLRSVHEFQWKLLAEDLRQIEAIGRQLVDFEAVSLEEYQRPAAEPRVAKQR